MFETHRRENSSIFKRCGVALLATIVMFAGTAHAQSRDSGEDAELVAAERALLEGLSSKGPSAFEQQGTSNSTAPQAELKPASYQPPVIKQEQMRDEPPVKTQKGPAEGAQNAAAKRVADAPFPDLRGTDSSPVPPPAVPNPNAALKRELETSQRRVSDLERQLEEVRGQLTMAETELSRLATISEARNRASLGRASVNAPPPHPGTSAPAVAKARMDAPHIEPTPSSSADLTIATVDVEKAELRLGPGKNHSALMTVAKGSRLAVEARQGEWLRVFAPNGQRAWVQSKVVAFGSKGSASSTTTTVRVRGYSSSLEDEAFKRVQTLTAGR